MVMASSGLLVGVHPSTGFRTMDDLVAAAKAKPVTFSSAGSGSPGHLAAEVLTEATGAKITHVPTRATRRRSRRCSPAKWTAASWPRPACCRT
jgi:tripartite-type tricarboxylate transporter receptor subunit TctC